MKLSDSKLNMIIEAHSKEEGLEIAKKEINYIRDILKQKTLIIKKKTEKKKRLKLT